MATTQLGKVLQRLRRDRGYTQEELGRRALVSASTVARIEQGKTLTPRSYEMERLERALDVPPGFLSGTGVTGETPAWVPSEVGDLGDVDVRVLAQFLVDAAESDERDRPIITENFKYLVKMVQTIHRIEKDRRRLEE